MNSIAEIELLLMFQNLKELCLCTNYLLMFLQRLIKI